MQNVAGKTFEIQRISRKVKSFLHCAWKNAIIKVCFSEENREKERRRKARTHRLIEHGALFETYFPQTVMMNKDELVAFLRELAA